MMLLFDSLCKQLSQLWCTLEGRSMMRNTPITIIQPAVAEVLDKPYSQLTPLSGVAVQARQSTVFLLCNLAGRYGYSAERA